MKRFEDMVAIIVGAADNMGRSAARILAEGGAKVAVTYYSNAAGVADTVRVVEEAGGEIIAIKLDHSEEDQVIAMVDQVIQRFGKINIVINNAAMVAAGFIAQDGDVVNMDGDFWDQNLKFNLKGPMLVCKHVIPHMIKAGYGSIVNTGSGVVFRG